MTETCKKGKGVIPKTSKYGRISVALGRHKGYCPALWRPMASLRQIRKGPDGLKLVDFAAGCRCPCRTQHRLAWCAPGRGVMIAVVWLRLREAVALPR